jgi:uncharacterized protein (DUF1501 family)
MQDRLTRREMLAAGAAVGLGAAMPSLGRAASAALPVAASAAPPAATPAAEAFVFIWLAGGVAQNDVFDPKPYTPWRRGMLGRDLLSTCPSIDTAAPGVRFGQGLEQLAGVMDRGTAVRGVLNAAVGGGHHLGALRALVCAPDAAGGVGREVGEGKVGRTLTRPRSGRPLPPPEGGEVGDANQPPSLGSLIAHTLGPRDPRMPAYFYLNRGAGVRHSEERVISEAIGPGCLGPNYAPVMAPNPAAGLSADERAAIDRAGYSPDGRSFAAGCALAGRLIDQGARFVQVEYPYRAFGGFDTHEFGGRRIAERKHDIDAPLAGLVRGLERAGHLTRTIVCVASEFSRTIAGGGTGEHLPIPHERDYGFHDHFAEANTALLFGGQHTGGRVRGATRHEHPMTATRNAVALRDVRAMLLGAAGA